MGVLGEVERKVVRVEREKKEEIEETKIKRKEVYRVIREMKE